MPRLLIDLIVAVVTFAVLMAITEWIGWPRKRTVMVGLVGVVTAYQITDVTTLLSHGIITPNLLETVIIFLTLFVAVLVRPMSYKQLGLALLIATFGLIIIRMVTAVIGFKISTYFGLNEGIVFLVMFFTVYLSGVWLYLRRERFQTLRPSRDQSLSTV